MAKYRGRVLRTDLEGGAFTFLTDQGVTYQLAGGGPDLLVDGARAEIDGKLLSGTVGIAMVGEVLQVKSYRRLP
jgi:hypothetical protein